MSLSCSHHERYANVFLKSLHAMLLTTIPETRLHLSTLRHSLEILMDGKCITIVALT